MKATKQLLALPLLAAALALPARAIEAPQDDAPPPRVDAEPAAKAESAYLGVVATEVPEMLAEHLGIRPGEGIIVRSVMPEGPADKAGIRVHDVITRVDNKAVGSPQDLTGEITARKPGDKVRIDLIQKGKPATLDVGLGVRPDNIGGIGLQPLDNLQLDGIPDDMAGRIRRMIEGNLGGLDLQLQAPGDIRPPEQIEGAMREMKERLQKAMGGIQLHAPGFGGKIDIKQGATFKMLDDQGSVEIKSNDDSKEVTIRDKDNNITWNGPWDTEQDKAAAPDDVRARIERLNLDDNFKGNGFRFKIGPGGLDAE